MCKQGFNALYWQTGATPNTFYFIMLFYPLTLSLLFVSVSLQ